MSLRFACARRTLAAGVLLAVLCVLAIEVAHGPHHDGSGVASRSCATCVAVHAPLVPVGTMTVVGVSMPTGVWCDLRAWREPTPGAVLSAASRGPPARA